MSIRRDDNHVLIDGQIDLGVARPLSSALYQTIKRLGYSDVVLDFSLTERAYGSGMLPLIAMCQYYERDGVTFEVRPPRLPQLKNLFHNANWLHLMNPTTYPKSAYLAERHVSALLFNDTASQDYAVKQILKTVLCSGEGLSKDGVSALQWSLDELTDNVLSHSGSCFGGVIQVTTYRNERRRVNVTLADAGIGIPRSLRDGGIRLHNDSHGLEQAIKEGVTSKPRQNQGNGLFGSYQIAVLSGGSFRLESGYGSLAASASSSRTQQQATLLRGTVVNFEIDCSNQDLLQRALRFKGQPHQISYDWLQADFKQDEQGDLCFIVAQQVASLRSRDAGKAVKNQIKNLVAAAQPQSQITIDFAGIPVISSSFADEVFGMLFAEYGAIRFMSKFKLVNVHPIVNGLIDRAIAKRVASSAHE